MFEHARSIPNPSSGGRCGRNKSRRNRKGWLDCERKRIHAGDEEVMRWNALSSLGRQIGGSQRFEPSIPQHSISGICSCFVVPRSSTARLGEATKPLDKIQLASLLDGYRAPLRRCSIFPRSRGNTSTFARISVRGAVGARVLVARARFPCRPPSQGRDAAVGGIYRPRSCGVAGGSRSSIWRACATHPLHSVPHQLERIGQIERAAPQCSGRAAPRG